MFLFQAAYLCFGLLMGVTWVWGFIMRFLSIIFIVVMMRIRVENGEALNFGQNLFMTAALFTLIETSLYINMKAKALLFLKVKTSE